MKLRVSAGQLVEITCVVNGVRRSAIGESRTLLSDFLRHQLNLYGTHVGCEHSVCGACTVIMDGRLARSCTVLAVQADGGEITTIEGLADDLSLNELRSAFSRQGALQCGFCIPGILASVSHFLKNCSNPNEKEIRDMLAGHLCRCTGYEGMVRAIQEAICLREESKPL